MHHFYNYSRFKRISDRFNAAQKEKALWRRVWMTTPILMLLGFSIGLKVAWQMDDMSALEKIATVAITAAAFGAVGILTIVVHAALQLLNDWIKPPGPDGKRRTSILVNWVLAPFGLMVLFIAACVLIVILMQPHPLNFVTSAFK